MPTYEYYYEENDCAIEVLHGMSETIKTWGELCELAGIDCGDIREDTPVERKLSAISLLPKKGESPRGDGGGCCGGGCGGH